MARTARSSCGVGVLLTAAIVFGLAAGSARATFPGRVGPIAFASKGDLFVLDPATGTTNQISNTATAEDAEPAWSPDLGTGAIAFQSRRAGNTDIYVVGAGGGGEQRLTRGAAEDSQPAWGPDDGSPNRLRHQPRRQFGAVRDGQLR